MPIQTTILNLEPNWLGIHTSVDHVLVQSHPSNMLSNSRTYPGTFREEIPSRKPTLSEAGIQQKLTNVLLTCYAIVQFRNSPFLQSIFAVHILQISIFASLDPFFKSRHAGPLAAGLRWIGCVGKNET